MSSAMTIRHLHGQCVSCGRHPPWPHVHTCPYCSEEVLMPRTWVMLRRVWLATVTGALGMVCLLPPMRGLSLQRSGGWSLQSWLLFSIASMLFLLPHPPRDVIVCSQRELLTWQIKSLLGALMIGALSLIGATQSVYARSDWAVAIACGVLVLCLLAAPWFFRLCAWRMWVGTVLVFVSCAV